jgi:hypothetical protein
MNGCGIAQYSTDDHLLTALYASLPPSLFSQSSSLDVSTDVADPSSLEAIALSSIIAHLEFVEAHQNWETTYAQFEALAKAMPRMTCCGARKDYYVEMRGTHKDDARWLLMR